MQEPTVLLLHNRYREPGGEERAIAEISALLRSRGHRVELLERSSESLEGRAGRALAGAAMLASGLHPEEVKAAVERTGAQIVHVHNINPLLGARAIVAARKAGARIVMHLHNYRLVCSIAIGYRDGDICTRCHRRNTLPGVRLRCRGGFAESTVYAAGLSLHQRRILDLVDRFVIPSQAAVDRLSDFGLSTDRMTVLHNFVGDSELAASSHAASGKYALFAGRLAEEKGADTAIEAATRANVPLLIAGSGPDAERLRALGGIARFAGLLSPSAMREARRRAAFAVAPSRWDEPGPYSVIEAMASGLPVLASKVGGLPEMVGPEATLAPRAVDPWASAMSDLWEDRANRQRRGEAALSRARELFGAERYYTRLMETYELVRRSR